MSETQMLGFLHWASHLQCTAEVEIHSPGALPPDFIVWAGS